MGLIRKKFEAWGTWLLLTAAADAVLIYVLGWPLWAWLATMAGMVAMIASLGKSINNRMSGIIIDNRNKISFSKFQMTCWTVMILSAVVIATLLNIKVRGFTAALDFTVDPTLWALMGISAVSFLGAPMILGGKAAKASSAAQWEVTQSRSNVAPAARNAAPATPTSSAQGQVLVNQDPADASWLDIFRGDEVGNGASVDLSKVQNFLITIVTLALYGAGLAAMFSGALPTKITADAAHKAQATISQAKEAPASPGTDAAKNQSAEVVAARETLRRWGIGEFPKLNEGFIYLLLISHGGYLAYKATSHSKDVDKAAAEKEVTDAKSALDAAKAKTPSNAAAIAQAQARYDQAEKTLASFK